MAMHPVPTMVSIRDLQRRSRAILDALRKSRGSILLLNHHTPEAVLMDVATYNALVGDDYLYDEEATAALIAQARASYRKGKAKVLRSWDDLD